MSVSHKRDNALNRGRKRSPRPKTFKSEDLANKWAEAQKIKSYDIVRLNMGLSKKVKIVSK